MISKSHTKLPGWFQLLLGVVACSLAFLFLAQLPRPVPSLLASIALVGAVMAWRSRGTRVSAKDEDIQTVQRHYDESEQRFRTLLESLPKVAVQGYDKDRRVIYWNEASARLYGYTSSEAIGRCLEDLLIPDAMKEAVIAAHRAWMEEGKEIAASELELKHRSGSPVPVFSHHVMLGEHTRNPLMFCIDVDLSEQKQARRELDYVTRFDALTHLPNRQTFEDELDKCLAESRHHRDCLAVVFIDIDQFAEINDAQGYALGDALLVEVAARLRQQQASSDLLSHFGGDEFVMAFPRLNIDSDAVLLMERLLGVFAAPVVLDNHELHITASIGVSLSPDNGATAHALIRNADVAKKRAKLAGRGSYCFFSQQFHDDLVRRHHVAERLQNALREDELTLHYQPQVAARSGRIESLEALLRWFPREGPAVSTGELVAVAERSDLIYRLGDWIMREACRQQAQWKSAGLGDCRVDINLSGKQVAQEGIFSRLESYMTEFGLTPRDIGIELTENILIQSDEKVLSGLQRLYHRGMKIALDDFGTGYSSLSYLKVLPVTSIKIDRSFVRDAPAEPSHRAIMEATVFIGHRLGLEVVAEGVENEDELELVREMGCDLVQGYYFFKPMASGDITKLLSGLMLAHDRTTN